MNLRPLSPLNLILTPLKQHLGCCVIAPLLIKLAGATVMAETLVKNSWAEFLFLLCALPVSVWAILKLEDNWRTRHERRHTAHHDACAAHCHPARRDFARRYAVNLGVAVLLAAALHLFFHHHTA